MKSLTGKHARVLIAVVLLLGAAPVWFGCSSQKTSAPPGTTPNATPAGGSAKISADPNPVPAGTERFGKTTITWDTGDGSVGEVFVSTNGAEEKLFAGNRAKGSLEAAWIGKGEYEFRLYAGKEHKTVLASVKVVKAAQ